MSVQTATNDYRQLLAHAQRSAALDARAKEQAYLSFKRQLSEMTLPVSYEKAIKELCQRLQY